MTCNDEILTKVSTGIAGDKHLEDKALCDKAVAAIIVFGLNKEYNGVGCFGEY